MTSCLGVYVPFSILATSSISFNVSTACWHTRRWWSVSSRTRVGKSRSPNSSSSSIKARSTASVALSARARTDPTTLRISWYTWAEMVACAAVAASASRCFISASRFARASVMSWPIPTTPMTLSLASRRVVAFKRTSTTWSPEVSKANSKFDVSIPSKAFLKMSDTESLKPSLTNSLMSFSPKTSLAENPVREATHLFQMLTRPSWSTPKIGALAESMRL
mmetsp:Transcript_1379/g.3274  ORF Transcript_1379/g.3274 Transcript_1379/m.3274 type:complete len:221 (+) Transcript_1379:1587-2249(+)